MTIDFKSVTPEILIPALRQYQLNKPTGELISGFDFEETCRIVAPLEQRIEALVEERDDARRRVLDMVQPAIAPILCKEWDMKMPKPARIE